ncbi:MAG: hypothetical protein ACM3KR_05600 [Deltaproteobacteria bacterium]
MLEIEGIDSKKSKEEIMNSVKNIMASVTDKLTSPANIKRAYAEKGFEEALRSGNSGERREIVVNLFSDALDRLSEIVKKDPSILNVVGVSSLITKAQDYMTPFGFDIPEKSLSGDSSTAFPHRKAKNFEKSRFF